MQPATPEFVKVEYISGHAGWEKQKVGVLVFYEKEIIFKTIDNSALRVYTTTIPSKHRIYTLMHDPQYRLSIAWQNVAYNQPPHTGFYLGEAMEPPPRPAITIPAGGPPGRGAGLGEPK